MDSDEEEDEEKPAKVCCAPTLQLSNHHSCFWHGAPRTLLKPISSVHGSACLAEVGVLALSGTCQASC